MIIRSPAEDKNGRGFLHTFSPRLGIPAHAGIQVRLPPQLAWIPAFTGMTEAAVIWRIQVLYSIDQPLTRIFEGGHEEHEVGFHFSQTFVSLVSFVVRNYLIRNNKEKNHG